MLIDIHSHLDILENPKKDIGESISRGVKIILTCGVDVKTNRKALELSKEFQEVKPCLGLYPTDALKFSQEEINNEIGFIKKHKKEIIAIGEIGLDLKESSQESLEKQKQNLSKFVNLGIELNLPVIIHSRKAEKQAIELLEKLTKDKKYNKIIMHCFSGKFKLIERIIKNGWFLTIPTNVKNSEHFQKLIEKCPLGQLFCETDSPFLHPDKLRNNIPGNVIESYKRISEIKNIPLNEAEKQLEKNYNNVFK